MDLKQQLQAVLAEARAIADRAAKAGRDLTTDEQTRTTALIEKGRGLKEQAEKAAAKASDEQLRQQIKEFGDPIGLGGPGRPGGGKGLGSYRRECSQWASQAKAAVERAAAIGGVKALVSGSISTTAPLADPNWEYAEKAKDPSRLVDLLVDRQPIAMTNTYSYLVQTLRDSHAAPVADGEEKPTSRYTMEEREGRVRVIAHLSEPTPERFFADSSELERFLESEMEEGLLDALEYQLVRGDGTGENLTGLGSTSGTYTQPWTRDLPTTLRKARTALKIAKEQPTAWAVHPTDQESIDLLREGADGAFLTGAFSNVVQGQLPIVETLAVVRARNDHAGPCAGRPASSTRDPHRAPRAPPGPHVRHRRRPRRQPARPRSAQREHRPDP